MHSQSTYKFLFLLNLLTKGDITKKEIAEEFKKNGIEIAKSTISYYIELFKQNDIEIITTTNSKKEKVYHLETGDLTLSFSENELNVIKDVKNLLIAQKNYSHIRKSMRLFYKLARFIKQEDEQLEFINFGYYSTINWHLVRTLEKHCKSKDVIMLDYMLPKGSNKLITIHVDSLKVGDWSDRLYLYGILENGNQFSHLPIDRIYMIKKIIKKNVPFDSFTDTLFYTISQDLYKKAKPDPKEKTIKTNNGLVTIQRPIDDDFYLIQRLLSFCPEVYYISDEKIKALFKEKLETLKATYDNYLDK